MKVIQLILIICAVVVSLPGKSPAAVAALPRGARYAHVVIDNRTGRTVVYRFTWGSQFEEVSLKPAYHKDHWYKLNPNGNIPPSPQVQFHLAAGVKTFGTLSFGFDNKPERYIIQADNRGDISLNPSP